MLTRFPTSWLGRYGRSTLVGRRYNTVEFEICTKRSRCIGYAQRIRSNTAFQGLHKPPISSYELYY
jgi:hypothetical protein